MASRLIHVIINYGYVLLRALKLALGDVNNILSKSHENNMYVTLITLEGLRGGVKFCEKLLLDEPPERHLRRLWLGSKHRPSPRWLFVGGELHDDIFQFTSYSYIYGHSWPHSKITCKLHVFNMLFTRWKQKKIPRCAWWRHGKITVPRFFPKNEETTEGYRPYRQ